MLRRPFLSSFLQQIHIVLWEQHVNPVVPFHPRQYTPTNEETVKNEASASGNSQPERNTGSNKNASGCPTLFARSNC